jgi:hypothetical protein
LTLILAKKAIFVQALINFTRPEGGDNTNIDFQIINFTRPEGGDNTSSISPTDNAVKLFM